METVLNL